MKGGRNRWELLLTGAAVLWIAVVFARIALTEPRGGGADEISLFNPVYMKLWTGKLAYPSYGFPDGMFIHPPVHVGFVALLIKAGLPESTFAAFQVAIPVRMWAGRLHGCPAAHAAMTKPPCGIGNKAA